MEFHGLSDEQIFEKVAGESPQVRFDGLMHLGIKRTIDKIDEAISFYQGAFALATEEDLKECRFISMRFLVNALRLADRHTEAENLLKHELSDDEALEVSDDEIGRAMMELALTLAEQGKSEDALKQYEAAVPFLAEQGGKCIQADFASRISDAFYDQRLFQLAANIGQTSRNAAQECDHIEANGSALYSIGRAYSAMRMFDEALKCFKEADVLFTLKSPADEEIWCRLNIAQLHYLRGEYDISLATLGEMDSSFDFTVPWCSNDLQPLMYLIGAQNLRAKGNHGMAATEYFRARTLLRAVKRNNWAAVAAAEGALAQLALGNIDEAVASAELGLRWFNEAPEYHTELWVRLAYAKVMNATGNQNAALMALSSAKFINADTDWQPHVEFRIELAKAELVAGDIKSAAAIANVVLEFFGFMLNPADRASMQEILAEAAVEANNLPIALTHFADAIATHSADAEFDQVARLTARLKAIANGEINRGNNEVIEGL